MNILEQLADHARQRVASAAERIPGEEMKAMAMAVPGPGFAFEKALRGNGLSLICECKKASPSKGIISPDFPYLDIALEYQAAGADALSVLTEPKWFLGRDEYLRQIASAVRIPCLRKDFTVDAYMLYEARALGASAALLICALLDAETLKRFLDLCDSLELSALVETHDEAEVRLAVAAGARVIGVNNRSLKDFTVDTGNSRRLRDLVPADRLFVSESGVRSGEDTRLLRSLGADAVLVGEALMRAPDKKAKVKELKEIR